MNNRLNNVVRTRRDLLIRVAALFRTGQLVQQIDRIPLEIVPRTGDPTRCCTYKDRAVLKYRLMSILGFGVDDEADELTALSTYTAEALSRSDVPPPHPSVLDIACDACTRGSHRVTDVCRGCDARPCTTSCPKDAVTVVNGRATIDEEKCINCGLCAKSCPFHAIVYQPVPCEQACPVDAITKDENGKIVIREEECISCGKCLTACPFAAVMDRSHMVDVLAALQRDRPVIAAVAPAGIGQFSAPFERLVTACRTLGFDQVYEVAAGADEVARRESAELLERLDGGAPFMTSSCCPAYTAAVERHFTELAPYVSHTPSPMVVSAEAIRAEQPDAMVVFVGPCLAKKREARLSGVVDAVLSFEELGAMFVAHDIDVQECEEIDADCIGGTAGRGFPISGGVSSAVRAACATTRAVQTHTIDGIDADATRLLKGIGKNPQSPTVRPDGAEFIEVMACTGGCVGGPLAYGTARAATRSVRQAVG